MIGHMDSKTILRTQVLSRRDEMTASSRAAKSSLICARLEHRAEVFMAAHSCTTAGRTPRVAVYAPCRSEVDILPFAESAYTGGWDVCFPCMTRDRRGQASMMFFDVSFHDFKRRRLPLLQNPLRCLEAGEPERCGLREAAPSSLDFVVVPLVAFDGSGNRLGYGGGNYDRLLPLLRADATVAGVAFEEQRVASVPVEKHDQPLSQIISA